MHIFRRKKKENNINWQHIQSIEELNEAYNSSKEKTALFFKHSTRCGISKMVLNRFESEWTNNEGYSLFFIDLLAHREVSNQLAEISGVTHQSPQVILIKNNEVIHDASHNGIKASTIKNII